MTVLIILTEYNWESSMHLFRMCKLIFLIFLKMKMQHFSGDTRKEKKRKKKKKKIKEDLVLGNPYTGKSSLYFRTVQS